MTPADQTEDLQRWHPGMAYNSPLNIMARACLAAQEEHLSDVLECSEAVFPI